jgi:hypothetical protein
MEYELVKDRLQDCVILQDLKESTRAILFLRGRERVFSTGDTVYAQGAMADDSFCVLLEGDLDIVDNGIVIRTITGPELLGEAAFFTLDKERTCTVRVASATATFLFFELDPAELRTPLYADLVDRMGKRAWATVVHTNNEHQPLAAGSV